MTANTIKVGDFELVQRDVNSVGEFELQSIFNAPTIGYILTNPDTAKREVSMYSYVDETPVDDTYDLSVLHELIVVKLNAEHGIYPQEGQERSIVGYRHDQARRGALLGQYHASKSGAFVRTDKDGGFTIGLNITVGWLNVSTGKLSDAIRPRHGNHFQQEVDVNYIGFQAIIDGAQHEGRLHYNVPVTVLKTNRKKIEQEIADAISTMNGEFGPSFKLSVTDVKLN